MAAPASSTRADLDFAAAVREGLSKTGQKELPSIYLYDDLGSALFEAITYLPEYGLTRAGERLLRMHSGEVLDRFSSPVVVAELGSGSGRKTRWILEELARRQPVVYYPIEISRLALTKCRRELQGLGDVSIVGLERTYLEGLREVASRRPEGQCMLVLFLGSTIGNFDRPAARRFLSEIRECLATGDALLLAADLEKPIPKLLLAYEDPIGLTAAFNLNLLARINRELGGGFVLRNFEHEARYNEHERRVEMHLRSKCEQTVIVHAADFTFRLRKGETIWTEACHKFNLAELQEMAAQTGFVSDGQWVDAEWGFAQNLWLVSPSPATNA
jgi:L-histidine N-alpha-methyltransferase